MSKNADTLSKILFNNTESFWLQLTAAAANKILCQDFTRLLSQFAKLQSVCNQEQRPSNNTIVKFFDVAITKSSNLNADAFKDNQLPMVITHLARYLFRNKGTLNFLKKN